MSDAPFHNLVVTKANELARAGHNLTLVEGKTLEYCISTIFKGQTVTADDVFEIDVNIIASLFGIDKTNAYKEVKKMLMELLTKVVTLEIGEEKLHFQWLSVLRSNEAKNGLLIQFNPIVCTMLSPVRLNQGRFTAYSLEDVAFFKHRFTLPLYNLIKSNCYEGNKFTTRIGVTELREFLHLQSTEYKLYGDLKRQLLACLNEIEQETGLKVQLHERKCGRKVGEVVFVGTDLGEKNATAI